MMPMINLISTIFAKTLGGMDDCVLFVEIQINAIYKYEEDIQGNRDQ